MFVTPSSLATSFSSLSIDATHDLRSTADRIEEVRAAVPIAPSNDIYPEYEPQTTEVPPRPRKFACWDKPQAPFVMELADFAPGVAEPPQVRAPRLSPIPSPINALIELKLEPAALSGMEGLTRSLSRE
jgi:hypothetical protein